MVHKWQKIIKLYTALIQTRTSSKRLRGKVLLKILNLEVFRIVYNRVLKSKFISKAIILTTTLKADDFLVKICRKNKIPYFRGSNTNVLKRYYDASRKHKLKNIIRITSDCPLIDPQIIDQLCIKFENNKFNYVSNVIKPTFPDGLDVEIFNFETLKNTYINSKKKAEKEHVTTKMIQNKSLKKYNLKLNKNFSNYRFTLDTLDDFKKIKKIFEKEKSIFKPNLKTILKEINKNKDQYKHKRPNYS